MNSGFVAKNGIFTAERQEAAENVRSQVDRLSLEVVRLSWPDQHGLLRGKILTKDAFLAALDKGAEITMAPFFFDTANAIVFNPFMRGGGFGDPALSGSPNIIMVPDPTTFRVLPWASATGWVLCDLYMRDGRPFPYAPRSILKTALDRLGETGYDFLAGIEIEWYLTRIIDQRLGGDPGAPGNPAAPPEVMPVARGYSYLLESHLDEIDDILCPIRQHLLALGLPLRSTDDEWGPSQVEITFDVLGGLAAADAVVLFRNAVKQICRRAGYLASFMCTPAIPGFYASGWHLHSSLQERGTGRNAMIPDEGAVLSELGRHYVGGTLAHAIPASVFTTPTVNGYRRRRPYSLAPDRVTWAIDNRAAMMRVIGSPGDPATHVENRVGEPAANPYLYIASQVISGWDGVVNKIDPGQPSEDPYTDESPTLPQDLGAAVEMLESDQYFRDVWGDRFIDYMVTMKRSELNRYRAHVAEQADPEAYAADVTDWEHREYFELF